MKGFVKVSEPKGLEPVSNYASMLPTKPTKADVGLAIQDHLAPAVKGLGEATIRSNMKIAESIESNGRNIMNGLTNGLNAIADEFKETRTWDEVKFLLKEIDFFEEELFKMGVLKEAYAKMQLKEIPCIEIELAEIEMLSLYNTEISMDYLKQWITYGNGKTPKEIIFDLISDVGIEFYDRPGWKEREFAFWTIRGTSVNFSLRKGWLTELDEVQYDEHYKIYSIQTDDVKIKNSMWEQAKRGRKQMMKFLTTRREAEARVLHFSQFVVPFYRNYIPLINLRNLYSELKQKYKEYKYKL